MNTLMLLVIGAFIGWHFPQPTWVAPIMSWVKAKFTSSTPAA